MQQSTATIIAALITLAGVIAGIAFGLKRWQRERRDARTADFTKERQTAYRQLWSNVEGLSVALRTETLSGDELRSRVRDLNAELLKAGLYIEEADRLLAASYISAVERFHRIVTTSSDPEAKVSFGDTGAIPPDVIKRVRELGAAQKDATELRDELIRRTRTVLTGGSPS